MYFAALPVSPGGAMAMWANVEDHDQAIKHSLGRARRLLRLLASAFDPRTYLHAIKLLNYYNYSHVSPMRKVNFAGARNVSPNAVFDNAERIDIGHRPRIGARCCLWAGPRSGRIIIGDDVLMGPGVMITAASYQYDAGSPVTDQPMREADIVIGHDVWLGAGSVILPGTTLGSGSIVAANAVVRGEFPPMSIIAGSPARIVKKRIVSAQGQPEASNTDLN